jgi:hypothetical protein
MHCEENEILNASLLSLNSKRRVHLADSTNNKPFEKNQSQKVKKRKTLKKKMSSHHSSQNYYARSSSQETENANFSGIGQILFPHNQINTSFTNSFDHNGNRVSKNTGKVIKPSENCGVNFNYNNYLKDSSGYLNPGYPNYNNTKLYPETLCNISFSNTHGRLITQMEIPELIKLLIIQFDFFLQILIQNMLLTNDKILLFRCYNILYSFYHVRQKVLTFSKIPEFGVKFDFCKIFNKNKDIILRPQISFFQAPILDIIPILVQFFTKTFTAEEVNVILKEFYPFINPLYIPIKKQNYLGKILDSNEAIFTMENINKPSITISDKNDRNDENPQKSDREPATEEIFFTVNDKNLGGKISHNTLNSLSGNQGSPPKDYNGGKEVFDNNLRIQKNIANVINNDANNLPEKFLNKKRKKFDTIYDNLLMIGLLYHGKKNIELIQQLWVNSRSIQEIRHRIKNLTCKRAPENLIKKWKKFNESPLSYSEFITFLKGLEWFGTNKKWNLISRYFLQERCPDYLEK